MLVTSHFGLFIFRLTFKNKNKTVPLSLSHPLRVGGLPPSLKKSMKKYPRVRIDQKINKEKCVGLSLQCIEQAETTVLEGGGKIDRPWQEARNPSTAPMLSLFLTAN